MANPWHSAATAQEAARLVAEFGSRELGQQIVVENKPGAGSNIATEQVVRAKPDGYTLLVETIANATNMTVYKNMKYDSVRDLAPIVQFMSSPSILCVAPSLEATNAPPEASPEASAPTDRQSARHRRTDRKRMSFFINGTPFSVGY